MAFEYFRKCPTLCFSVNRNEISEKMEEFLSLINFLAT